MNEQSWRKLLPNESDRIGCSGRIGTHGVPGHRATWCNQVGHSFWYFCDDEREAILAADRERDANAARPVADFDSLSQHIKTSRQELLRVLNRAKAGAPAVEVRRMLREVYNGLNELCSTVKEVSGNG